MIKAIQVGNLVISNTLLTGFTIGDVSGLEAPQLITDIKSKGNYQGATFGLQKRDKRVITIEMMIVANSQSDYESKRRALIEELIVGELQNITITTKNNVSLYVEGVVTKLDLPIKKAEAIFTNCYIEIIVPYPYLLSSLEYETTINIVQGQGFAVPFAVPFDIGQGASNGATIAINGNGVVYPILTFYGVMENPSIQNDLNGEVMSIVYDLALETDYITVDVYNRTAVLNGVTNVRTAISGDWITLIKGLNVLKLNASTSENTANVVVSYRDSYIGV